jgi:hypothetical protein
MALSLRKENDLELESEFHNATEGDLPDSVTNTPGGSRYSLAQQEAEEAQGVTLDISSSSDSELLQVGGGEEIRFETLESEVQTQAQTLNVRRKLFPVSPPSKSLFISSEVESETVTHSSDSTLEVPAQDKENEVHNRTASSAPSINTSVEVTHVKEFYS